MAEAISGWSLTTSSGEDRTAKTDLHLVRGKPTIVWNLPGGMTEVIEEGHHEHLRHYLFDVALEALRLAGVDPYDVAAEAALFALVQEGVAIDSNQARHVARYVLDSLAGYVVEVAS